MAPSCSVDPSQNCEPLGIKRPARGIQLCYTFVNRCLANRASQRPKLPDQRPDLSFDVGLRHRNSFKFVGAGLVNGFRVTLQEAGDCSRVNDQLLNPIPDGTLKTVSPDRWRLAN